MIGRYGTWYLFGGRFTMRYCYNHDSHEGQLFHLRAYESLLEYNWLARPAGYMGDIMTCEYLCGPDTSLQHMTLRGNVMIQGTPDNGSQIIALYKDEDGDVYNMSIDLLYNTVIGTPRGGDHFLVHMVNQGIETHATFYNNIIYQVADLVGVESLQSIWSAEGANNWVSDGTNDTGLSGTLTGSDPGFVDLAALDFTLTSDAPVRGQADTSGQGLPNREYYRNETVAMQSRDRPSANDLGAFEFREQGDDTDSGGDEDTDTGAERATDTDANAGGDTDGDTDADVDVDTDGDADGDTDGDTDGDADGDADSDADMALDTENQDAGSAATGQGGSCSCRHAGESSRGSIVDVMLALF